METRPARLGGVFTQFIVLVSLALQACAPSGVVEQVNPKESKMKSPPNPQDPRKPGPAATRVAEMVAATSEPFYLGPQPTEITLAMHAPTGPAASQEASTQREVYLYIENFTCSKAAPPFRVYVNVPRGDIPERHPELLVGNLGTFGLRQASDPLGPRAGNGLSFTVDITDALPRLIASKNWDPRNLRVSFTPGYWEGQVPAVKVGRVSLYFK